MLFGVPISCKGNTWICWFFNIAPCGHILF